MRPRFAILPAALTLLAFALCSCDRAPETAPASGVQQSARPEWFQDATMKLGIDFVHESGARGEYFMPESFGSGVALFDYDNDGRLDIYLIQCGGANVPAKNQLYHQEPDGHFKNVSAGSGLDIVGRGTGVAIGDINNDGFPDVLVCEFGAVHLFLNHGGDGTFTEITKEAGLDNPQWASAAAFVDYDRDGRLDLVIVNYIQYKGTETSLGFEGKRDYPGPSSFSGCVTKLYHNLGRGAPRTGDKAGGPSSPVAPVRFEDVTVRSGLIHAPGPGLGVVCADFDGDGWPDIFITDDGKPNRLLINQRNGTFKNEAVVRGIAYNGFGVPQANMGIAIGDVDGDGLFDVYVTHLTEETNILWKQGPAGLFQDRTSAAGLAAPSWRGTGFGDAFADFDNDGSPDLAVVNGRVRRSVTPGFVAPFIPELGRFWSDYAERNQLFANEGAGKFRDISEANPAFCQNPGVGRGLAVGDIDGDGGLDLLVTNCNGPAKVYRNVVPNRGHWLLVRAIDPALGGRDAYGAKITVVAGGRRRVGWINPGYSYLSSRDPRAHFWLGAARTVESIEVVWPDGSKEHFPAMSADKLVVLRHGGGHAQTQDKNR